jgi:hypothetical protein
MYGPIAGNIPGLSTADSAIVFEFLAKVIQFCCCSIHADAIITSVLTGYLHFIFDCSFSGNFSCPLLIPISLHSSFRP